MFSISRSASAFSVLQSFMSSFVHWQGLPFLAHLDEIFLATINQIEVFQRTLIFQTVFLND